MRKIISLICLLLPAFALAAEPEIRPDAPSQHVVVPGDTLWSISNLFFKDPWKWPNLWGANREKVKDPHWIYPGAVIYLDRAKGSLQLGDGGNGGGVSPSEGVVRLKPQARPIEGGQNAIFSIPGRVIAPFLAQPMAVEENELQSAPTLVALQEDRVMLGQHELGYARGLPQNAEERWQVYLPGKALVDPDSEEVLAHEVVYLGDMDIVKWGNPSTLKVSKVRQEISVGAHLVIAKSALVGQYLPHPPVEHISAKVISLYGGMTQASQNSVITLNKGRRDGVEEGHVLALYKAGKTVKYQDEDVHLPDERNGLLFIFRVFEKVSYALVMETRLPVVVLDNAETP